MSNNLRSISEEKVCLHYDINKIDIKEYQDLCLKNNKRTLQLGILGWDSGTAAGIYSQLNDLLDECNAWKSIQIIISDITTAIKGCKNDVIVKP